MKATLTQDEFAKFIAEQILTIEMYQFDILYDVRRIVDELQENRGNSEKPVLKTFHLMIRSTGCDLVEPNDENYNLFEQRSDKIFCLNFCWNRDYFNLPFCEVTKFK